MIDTVRLNIKAGNGGNGCVSFLRQKYRPKGGPNGGDGGDGGSAYVVGDPSLNTLLHLKFNSTIYVERGQHGKGKGQKGRNGENSVIKVPIGTVVWRLLPDGDKEFCHDITDETPRLVARGGRGGWGNEHYVSSTNQEPLLAEKGEAGEAVVLFLELKLLADVGLIAKPNAGKSTLISRCSAAQPKIADYPFTTVEPVLGVVARHGRDFVMMEVPGLIEGAHEGVGLGDQFLRHAERARLYIHMVDGLSEDPIADFLMINDELRRFNPALADKPQVVVVNKLDVTEVRARRHELMAGLQEAYREIFPDDVVQSAGDGASMAADMPVFFISAVTGEGIESLLDHVFALLDVIPKDGGISVPEVAMVGVGAGRRRPAERVGFRKENGVFVVESQQLERLTALADLRDYRVLLQVWREMNRLGIAQKLEQAGIEVGDTIRIGRAEMEWF